MALTIDSVEIRNLNFDNYFIKVNATTDDPPLMFSIDNVNFQAFSGFEVPRNEIRKRYVIVVTDNVNNKATQTIFADECDVEVNKNNFRRWKNYTGLVINNGQVENAVCPGIVLGNTTPVEAVKHCPVFP